MILPTLGALDRVKCDDFWDVGDRRFDSCMFTVLELKVAKTSGCELLKMPFASGHGSSDSMVVSRIKQPNCTLYISIAFV